MKNSIIPQGYPDLYMYAFLCSKVYAQDDPNFKFQNWKCLRNSRSSRISDYAYKAVAFINEADKRVIIVHRGTIDGLENWTTANVPMVISHQVPEVYKNEVLNFSKGIRCYVLEHYGKDYIFSETGHSLGGMYAQLNGYIFGGISISFDSPGVGFLRKDLENLRELSNSEPLHYNFVTAPNLVNVSGDQYGEWFRIFPFHVQDSPTDLNSIGTLIESILGAKPVTGIANVMVKQFFEYDLYNHSIENILNAFSQNARQPYLQAKIESWPSRDEYLKHRIAFGFQDFEKIFFLSKKEERNSNYEYNISQLPNYSVNYLFAPKLSQLSSSVIEEYKYICLERFKVFFPYNKKTLQNLEGWFDELRDSSNTSSMVVLFSLTNNGLTFTANSSYELQKIRILHVLHAIEFDLCKYILYKNILQNKEIKTLLKDIKNLLVNNIIVENAIELLKKIQTCCDGLSKKEREFLSDIISMTLNNDMTIMNLYKAINDNDMSCDKNYEQKDNGIYDYLYYQGTEAVGGVIDNLSGTLNTFLHPIDTVTGIFNAVTHPIDTCKGVANHAYNHPVRFASGVLTGWAVGKVASFGIGKVNNYFSGTEALEKTAKTASTAKEAAHADLIATTNKVVESTEKIKGLGKACSNAMSDKLYGATEWDRLVAEASHSDAVNNLNIQWQNRQTLMADQLVTSEKLLDATKKAEEASKLAEATVKQASSIKQASFTMFFTAGKSGEINLRKEMGILKIIQEMRLVIKDSFQSHFYSNKQSSWTPSFHQKQSISTSGSEGTESYGFKKSRL